MIKRTSPTQAIQQKIQRLIKCECDCDIPQTMEQIF